MFNNIWNEHKDHLLNFIKTKIDDEELAHDILQEVSIKLHDNLERNTEIQNYKSWLFQVTRNTIVDHHRKNKQHEELSTGQIEIETESGTCICDLSGFVIQNYLPEDYSQPLYLSDIEKISQQEIANQLGLSLTATKSRIQRARQKLKNLIMDCVDITFNDRGQVTDFNLKPGCELPPGLLDEIEKLKIE